MEIVAGILDWTLVDEERWAKWLQTETGKRLLPRLAESTPMLLASGDVNAILIRSGEVRGFQAVLSQLLAMSHATPEKQTSNSQAYPPLEDDTAWNDGQKLEPEPKD
jgi:hypothetical protein